MSKFPKNFFLLYTVIIIGLFYFEYNEYATGMDPHPTKEAMRLSLEILWPLIVIWIFAFVVLIYEHRSQ